MLALQLCKPRGRGCSFAAQSNKLQNGSHITTFVLLYFNGQQIKGSTEIASQAIAPKSDKITEIGATDISRRMINGNK